MTEEMVLNAERVEAEWLKQENARKFPSEAATCELHERIAIVADGCNVSDEEAEIMVLRHEFEQRQRQLIREREAKHGR